MIILYKGMNKMEVEIQSIYHPYVDNKENKEKYKAVLFDKNNKKMFYMDCDNIEILAE